MQNHELRLEVDWGKLVHVQVSCPRCGRATAICSRLQPPHPARTPLCDHPCPLPAPVPQLVEGQAEVFGTSLDLGERVTIGGQKVAVYTWQGCTLTLDGDPDIV